MQLPATFGKYQLLERIATGGMAELFLARSFGVEGFERRLVIKRILPALSGSPHFTSLFIREARISALLSHPNVVQVYGLEREQDDYFISMEYIHGRDLTQVVRRLRARSSRMPLEFAVYIVADIARGLAYAHSRSGPDGESLHIVHRDVSPHNVLLSFQGEVKLVDFGIARLFGTAEAQKMKGGGHPGGGKFAYMSPEQANGDPLDRRSDVFSCGIVLYELLVNHRLFQDPDPAEKLRRVREAVIPDPRGEVPDMPERLWQILQKALARAPEDRYATADLLEEDLRALQYELGSRCDAVSLSGFVRGLFEEEVGPDPGAAQLANLARELERMDRDDHSVSESSLADRSLSAPPQLAPSRSLDGVVAEQKRVAVMVAEVLGLTDVSEHVDPEEMLRKEQALLQVMMRVVERHEGWLMSSSQDGLTVLFGVPRAHEDDVGRSLACARQLLRTVGRLRQRGYPVALGVGIHCGQVAFTQEGEQLHVVARGGALKLARRLSAAADPGEIVLSDEVASRCDERWRVRSGPRIQGRSRGAPQARSWVLVGRRSPQRRGPGKRWIRRGDELEVLSRALSRLASGGGGVLSIEGNTGSGKSRLVREVRGLADRAEVSMYSARAAPYGSDGPLSALRELVAEVLGIDDEQDSEQLRARLGRLGQLRLSSADIATIAAFFSVELGGRGAPSSEDQISAGVRLVRGLAEQGPLLVAVEDVQELAREERALLAAVMRGTRQQQVLWILTHPGALPEHLPTPDQGIRLQPLPPARQRQLLADLLGVREVTERLFEAVSGRAQGNALYTSEMVKALQDKGLVGHTGDAAQLVGSLESLGLPPTLEALIASRVDGLEATDKEALRVAAVIGPTLSPTLLAEATGLDDLADRLRVLTQAGLLTPEGRADGAHRFSSQLVRRVVLSSLLQSQLKEIHGRVAVAIERVYRHHLEPHHEALAEHCFASGRGKDAAEYMAKAGDMHRRGSFVQRALRAYRQAVHWLDGKPWGAEAERLEASLRLEAGELELMQGDLEAAERNLQVALDIAAEAMMVDVELGCYLALGQLYAESGQLEIARANLELGLSQARSMGLMDRVVSYLDTLGKLACDRGDYEEAQRILSEAVDLAGDDEELAAIANLGLGTRFLRAGDLERALVALRRARRLAGLCEDPILLGKVVNNLGLVHHAAGRFEDALALFREALELRRGTGYRPGEVINLHNIGDALLRLEQPGRAFAAFRSSRDAAREAGLEKLVTMNEVFLGYLSARQGDAKGMQRLRTASQRAQELGDEETVLTARWLEGRLIRESGDEDSGRLMLQEVLSACQDSGAQLIAREIEAELP